MSVGFWAIGLAGIGFQRGDVAGVAAWPALCRHLPAVRW